MVSESPSVPTARANSRPSCVLVHYSEIALKGKNRAYFEQSLVHSIRLALQGLGVRSVRRLFGRLIVELEPDGDDGKHGNSRDRGARVIEALAERLRSIYGIAHFEPAVRTGLDLEEMKRVIVGAIDGVEVASFAMRTQRSNKRFPMKSIEVNAELGAFVVGRTGWKVSIRDPELPIFVHILDREAYIAFERFPGPGGLPVGVAGRVACLLSGGIDSPVAASRMMRRGAATVFIHFHSAPHTSAASQEKVRQLAEHLMRFYQPTRLYMIAFSELQRRIVAESPAPLRVILYRRFMIRAAEVIARREKSRALVTGENLSQVSSQTLDNLATIQSVATMPILRPVIGLDKQEIIEDARRIGTFDVSIEPHDDCCSFLMPQHPATHSTPAQLEKAERDFDVDAEVEKLVESAKVEDVGGSGWQAR